jgi:hypothetical protein
MGIGYYNGFDVARIDADSVRVPLPNETFNLDEVGGGSLGTIDTDDYGCIVDGSVGLSGGVEIEFSHDTYPEVFRRLLTDTADEAPLLRENAKTTYIAENLAGETQSVVGEIWLRDDDNPDTPDVLIGHAREGETPTFPYETTGPTKNLTLYIQPITETGEKKHLRYEEGDSAAVVIDSSSPDAADRPANTVFAGPTAGPDDAPPTFRSLVVADIPVLSGVYQPLDATLTGLAALTIAQGDLVYGSGSDTFAILAKNTGNSRYLSNQGVSNNPAWAQIDLLTGVQNTLPIANGGTNQTAFGTSGGVAYYNGSALAVDAGMTYDATNDALIVGGSRFHAGPVGVYPWDVFLGANAGNFTHTGIQNTGIGYLAGFALTNGAANTLIGSNSGGSITSGNYNTIVAASGGDGITTGSGNCILGYAAGGAGNVSGASAFGYAALQTQTSGVGNSAFGYGTGTQITTNGLSSFFGYNAGTLATGANCVYVGGLAGYQITSGDNNTFLGSYTGGAHAGSMASCVFIGHGAGYNETASNRLHIHNSTASSPTVSLIYGEFDNFLLRVNGNLYARRTSGAQITAEYDGSNRLSVTVGSTGIATYDAVGSAAKHVFSDDVEVNGRIFVTKTTEQMRLAYDVSNYLTITVASNGSVTYDAVGSTASHHFSDAVVFAADVTLDEGKNLLISDGTGSKFGDVDSVMAWWGATPISQPDTGVASASFTANSGTAVNDASTFDGYTLRQIVRGLRLMGKFE